MMVMMMDVVDDDFFLGAFAVFCGVCFVSFSQFFFVSLSLFSLFSLSALFYFTSLLPHDYSFFVCWINLLHFPRVRAQQQQQQININNNDREK
jgi:hypothetical protein